MERPSGAWQAEISGEETIRDLRNKLLHAGHQSLLGPQPITVTGTLFPCALLSSGWWDKQAPDTALNIEWRDGIQEWLFQGFDLWGPSWDFTWDFDSQKESENRRYFIAQLGDGDEANSLPLLIPAARAQKLRDHVLEKDALGVFSARVKCVLGHRSHFKGELDERALELFGGLLDYCLWLDENEPKHKITRLNTTPPVYSGYLWRCIAPQDVLGKGKPSLSDVYFIWEHTNFACHDAIQYNLDALERKQEYLERRYGKLVLLQKSSWLTPGTPEWSRSQVYGMLLGNSVEF